MCKGDLCECLLIVLVMCVMCKGDVCEGVRIVWVMHVMVCCVSEMCVREMCESDV